MAGGDAFLSFQRAKFKTRLPRARLYTEGHMWLREAESGLWHVGLTRFALRMLGEPVEVDFECERGRAVERGQVVGWLEGFKAVTDLFAPIDGAFEGGNEALDEDIARVASASYESGWLFALRGEPGPDCLDVDDYAGFLEATIDRMLGDQA